MVGECDDRLYRLICKKTTWEEVLSQKAGYRLVVQIDFDTTILPYWKLLEVFWKVMDPIDAMGQFTDRGAVFQSAIYYGNQGQKDQALFSKNELKERNVSISNCHRNFTGNGILPCRSQYVYKQSGRAAFIEHWKVIKETMDLREKLTAQQYEVTQDNKTERFFKNEYYDQKLDGIYVDLVTGVLLFSTTDQYDAGCGWPNFTKPIQSYLVKESLDRSHGMIGTELRSLYADSHLEHVFDDGPKEKGGRRYCLNSAALRFIQKDHLEIEGYGEYLSLSQRI